MIFYKLLCISPNLEILLTSIYTTWCLCSTEILSLNHLVDKINLCWSTNGLGVNFVVTYLKYAVCAVHIFQFIFAYIMLVAEIITVYPILSNKLPNLLSPIIIASKIRQIYFNCASLIIGGLLCYFSGSKFKEFETFFGKFLINIILSYYIIYSYEDFREYVRTRPSHIHPEILETKYVVSEETIDNPNPEKKIKLSPFAEESINRMNGQKILPTDMQIKESVNCMSISSTPYIANNHRKMDTFQINLIDHKTKAPLMEFTILKKN